jgi:inner membrane protein
MEPVTHFLTGACLARAGFNRKSAYATLAMTLAAEAPDLDTLWSWRGPVAAFQHHRGWTHTLLGLPFEAAIILGAVWLWHRWKHRNALPADPATITAESSSPPARRKLLPPRWGLLYLFALVALVSHILLDWTNNYGVRPFFPFNSRWYAGSFVFIFEPVMFVLLLIGLIAPALFGLVGSEVGARREPFRGRGWATFALCAIAALWFFRSWERTTAEHLVHGGDFTGTEILRTSISPYPITPFTWHAVVETPTTFQLATVDTLSGSVATSGQDDVFYKIQPTLAILAAKRSWLGEVYLDWSSFPVLNDSGPDPDGISQVTFRDLRFLYDVSFMHGRESPPLSGTVSINNDRQVVSTEFDGRVQK